MKRKTVKAIAIIIILAMVITSFSFVLYMPVFGTDYAYGAETPTEQKYLDEQLEELERYLKWISENYMDEIDFKTLVNGAFEGAMHSLGDPYSIYYLDIEEGQSFLESATGDYSGVGLTISQSPEGLCEVTSVIPDTPAKRAGIREQDIIVKIDGKDVTKAGATDVAGMLKGKIGTKVNVTVRRAGAEHSFSMTREEIHFVSLTYKMIEGNIGYITFYGFESTGADAFKKAKADLVKQGAKSLIVDIRNNSGGMIATAVGIADEFIEGGVIFHYKQKGRIVDSERAKTKKVTKMPTVLLVNGYSASAAEILAGALKDHKAAILVGETTYGKGAAQIMEHTKDGHPFKLSTFYFLTPNRHDIHKTGITPDHVVRNSLGEFREEAAEMYYSFAPFAETTRPKAGDVGLNVFAAQQRLRLLGFTVTLNAVMDQATFDAVKEFQREQGLYPYGQLDMTTMRKIEEVTLAYINNDSSEDLQLKKAIELLKQ